MSGEVSGMETWKKVGAFARFFNATAIIRVVMSHIENFPWWLTILSIVVAIFMVFEGIDALKED